MAWSRRKSVAAVGLGACALGASLSFGPVARSRIFSTADRLGLDVSVGHVWPIWFGARLVDVVVKLRGVDDVSIRFDELSVRVDGGLHPASIDARGGSVDLRGSVDSLRASVERWRTRFSSPPAAPGDRTAAPRLAARELRLHWSGVSSDVSDVDASDFEVSRDAGIVRLAVSAATVSSRQGRVAVSTCDLNVGSDLVVSEAHAAKLDLTLSRSTNVVPPPPSPSGSGLDGALATGDAPSVFEAKLISVEELRTLAVSRASELARHLRVLGSVRADAATVALDGSDAPITIGPGSLVIERSREAVRVEYATAKDNDGTPLALVATVPLAVGDVSVSVEGGPLSLAALGLHDGAAGLFDTTSATVAGRTKLVASADSLTFDGEVHVRNLSAKISRLASEPIRNMDAGIQARGAVSSDGALRLDDVAVSLGALTISGSGGYEPFADHSSLHFRGEVARGSCQALLDSMPTALIPTLRGVRYVGTFSASGTFAADTNDLDHLVLDYMVDDGCRVVDVPPELARERFTKPFSHRIYHPDGSSGEVTTGPGAPGWVPFGDISPFMIVAVMTTEDGGFYRHHGFSRAAIRSALIDNLKARRFVRGASTVSMQLAKNLFLTREKTVGRKLEEVVLTDYLEQTFTKDELMELYLNVIEFGPDLYGIGPAARDYFGRGAGELDLAESLFLSSVLPSPLKMHGMKFADHLSDGWQRTIAHLMSIAHRSGLISQAELDQGRDEIVFFHNTGPRPPPRRFEDAVGTDSVDDPTPPLDEKN